MTIVFSKRVSAFVGSPASRSLLPSSVSRSEAARCGDVPGVIFASNELSSGSAGVKDSEVTLACLVLSLTTGEVAGPLGFSSCSLIFDSWGSGFLTGSVSSGGGGPGRTVVVDEEGLEGGIGIRYGCRGAQPCIIATTTMAATPRNITLSRSCLDIGLEPIVASRGL